jgi:hypothetical protein
VRRRRSRRRKPRWRRSAPPNELAPDAPVELDVLDVLVDAVLDPLTCWPTARSTEATVPAMVEVRVASANDVWALVTCVSAEATLASSEAIWAADAPSAWSVESWDWSRASVAWAWARVADSEVLSTVARGCPTVTVCPAVTSTALTRPLTAKLRLA